jgi:HK97 family phage prohead protease
MNMPKIKDGLEQRSYSFEIRAEQTEDETGVITGRPIVYNSRTDLGWFDEVIESGALDGADLRDVRFLVNHDISKIPLARSRNNNANSTMQLMPDLEGMAIRVNLDVKNNSDARNLYSAIERGDISGMSFMFSVDDEEWENLDSDHPTRHIRKISNVVEVSAVTFPAYESTEISVRNKEALESAKLALENAKRSQEQTLDSERESELTLAKAKFEALLKVR